MSPPKNVCSIEYSKPPKKPLYTEPAIDSEQNSNLIYRVDDEFLAKDYYGVSDGENSKLEKNAVQFVYAYERLYGEGSAILVNRPLSSGTKPDPNPQKPSVQTNSPLPKKQSLVSVLFKKFSKPKPLSSISTTGNSAEIPRGPTMPAQAEPTGSRKNKVSSLFKGSDKSKSLESISKKTGGKQTISDIRKKNPKALDNLLKTHKENGVCVEDIQPHNVIFDAETEELKLTGLENSRINGPISPDDPRIKPLEDDEVNVMKNKLEKIFDANDRELVLNNYALDEQNKVASMGRQQLLGPTAPKEEPTIIRNIQETTSELKKDGVTTVIMLDKDMLGNPNINNKFTAELEAEPKRITFINDEKYHIEDYFNEGKTDITPAQLHQLILKIDEIQMANPNGKIVLVCAAGNGRSSVVKSAYSIWKKYQKNNSIALDNSRQVYPPRKKLPDGTLSTKDNGSWMTKQGEGDDDMRPAHPIVYDAINDSRKVNPESIERPHDVKILNEYAYYLKRELPQQAPG